MILKADSDAFCNKRVKSIDIFALACLFACNFILSLSIKIKKFLVLYKYYRYVIYWWRDRKTVKKGAEKTVAKALIIVDVQRDFCPGGTLAVNNGDEVIPPLNRMIAHARANNWLIIVTRDWHPEYMREHFKKDGGAWPVHCVQNTLGAEFHPDLNIGYHAHIISKGNDPLKNGYSGFESRLLETILNLWNVDAIYIGGLATDYCVKETALDARRKTLITIWLLTDAIRAVKLNEGDEEKALQQMRDAGVLFTTTDDVLVS